MKVAFQKDEGGYSGLDALKHTGAGYYVLFGLLLALVIWWLWNLATKQWAIGLGVTGMNTPTYWGVYIVNFVFFIGLSAGGIIVAAMVHALGVERFRPVSRIAEVLAIISLILATVFIFLDLGRPQRVLNLIIYGQLFSPLIWDVVIITVYFLITLALGYLSSREDLVKCMGTFPSRRGLYRLLCLGYTDVSPHALERDRKILRVLAIVAIPAAIGLHSITAWILGLVKAQATWHTPLLAPLFVVSAIVSGLALVTVVAFLSKRFLRAEIEEGVIASLGKVLALLLPLLGYFLFSELLTALYAQEEAVTRVFREMTVGRFAPFFWFNMATMLLPFLILGIPLVFRLAPKPAAAPYPRLRPAWATAVAILLSLGMGWAVITSRFSPFAASAVEAQRVPLFLFAGLAVIWLLVLWPYLRPGTASAIFLSSLLVVIGVLAERTLIVLPSQATKALPYPPVSYTPTPVEAWLVIGAWALGAIFFLLFAKVVPLAELKPSGTK